MSSTWTGTMSPPRTPGIWRWSWAVHSDPRCDPAEPPVEPIGNAEPIGNVEPIGNTVVTADQRPAPTLGLALKTGIFLQRSRASVRTIDARPDPIHHGTW